MRGALAGPGRVTLGRYLLSCGLLLLSLWAVLRFSVLYARRGLPLGLLCTLALGGLLLGGFLSFARARLRLGRELAALPEDPPPPGTLIAARAERLAEVSRRGVRPNLQALAQEAAASLAGRAYLGRYFVAVAVLIGLLGTFAGLMETLSGVETLLGRGGDKGLDGVLALIAAPLSGLDVTFGASMAGILCTVTLAVIQGDLHLCDEEFLARLEEHTAHVLVPALWPQEAEPSARLMGEMERLRREVAGGVDALLAQVERMSIEGQAQSARLGAQAAERIDALGQAAAQHIEAHAASTADALARQAQAGAELLDQRMKQGGEALSAYARRMSATVEGLIADMLARSAEDEERRAAQRVAALAAQDERLLSGMREGLSEMTRAVREDLARTIAEVAAGARRMTECAADLFAQVERRSALLLDEAARRGAEAARQLAGVAAVVQRGAEETAQTIGERVREGTEAVARAAAPLASGIAAWQGASSVAAEGAARLDASAAALVQASAGFAQSTGALLPHLEALSPELHALSAQLALLFEREERAERDLGVPAQLVAEMIRLTEAVERLERRIAGAEAAPGEALHASPSIDSPPFT